MEWTQKAAVERLRLDYARYLTLPGCGWTTVPIHGTATREEAQQVADWMAEEARELDPRIVVEVDELINWYPAQGRKQPSGRYAVGLRIPGMEAL